MSQCSRPKRITWQIECMCCIQTCESVAHALVLDLPDARGLCVDVADGGQLMRQLCLLSAEANGMRVLWAQRLWLTVHLQPQ